VVVLAVSGCSTGPGPKPSPTTSVSAAPGPQDDAFFVPPATPADAKPGELIWARPISGLQNSYGYDILYWSTTVDDTLVATSGLVFWPAQETTGPRPIVAWAHGTAGLGDQCAPSKWDFDQPGMARSVAASVIRSGGVFVASDYEGLGPPGEHPYIVGHSAGRNVLDSIRAATELTGLEISASVAFGESQGGGAALFAAELAPTYAPDVGLDGAVAVAPPADLTGLMAHLDGSPYFGYTLMAINGIAAAYPEAAALQADLGAEGKAALAKVKGLCSDVVLTEYAGKRGTDYGIGAILNSAVFRERLTENEPGKQKTSVPVLLVHGEADDTVPASGSRELLADYCAIGVSVTAKFVPGKGHANTTSNALPQIVDYMNARFAGTPPPPPACP
jgi:pimeloyl-ACP methyl ester carboxylesterase